MEVVFPNDTTAVLTYRVSQNVAPRVLKWSTPIDTKAVHRSG